MGVSLPLVFLLVFFPSAQRCRMSPRPAKRARLPAALEILEGRLAPAVYTVNQLGDAGNGNVPTKSGDIRFVINQINNSPGTTDTINFALPSGSTIFLTHGQLAFSSGNEHVTVNGLGAGALAIDGASGSMASRVFEFNSANGTFAINALSITGGNGSTTFSATSGTQGGDLNIDNGSVTLTAAVVSHGKVVGSTGLAGAQGPASLGAASTSPRPGRSSSTRPRSAATWRRAARAAMAAVPVRLVARAVRLWGAACTAPDR